MRSSRTARLLAAACFLSALGAAGCARRLPTPPHPAPPTATGLSPHDALALMEAVSAREARIQTLRATFMADVERDGTRRSVTGVLVIAKPRRFRFRLMLPFGVTVFDEVQDGRDLWRLMPLGSPAVAMHDADSLGQAFLAPAFDPTRCQFAAPHADLVEARCDGRHMAVRPGDATIATEWFSSRAVAQYDDERSVDGTLLPFRIALTYPGGVSVQVAIDRYELNPALGPGVFTPPPGAEHIDVAR